MHGIKQLLGLVSFALVWVPSSGYAADTAPRTYAVISLIGDKINVVSYPPPYGADQNQTQYEAMTLDARPLDDTAVIAASDTINQLDSRAAIVMLSSGDPALYAVQNEIFEPREQSRALLASAIKGPVQAQHATHLVLIRKHRANAVMRMETQYVGAGKLEGIGFYRDASSAARRLDKYALGRGFLAAFAYIKVTLVDANTMAIIAEQTSEDYTILSTARADGGPNPLDVLTSAQKTALLRSMIIKATTSCVKAVLESK